MTADAMMSWVPVLANEVRMETTCEGTTVSQLNEQHRSGSTHQQPHDADQERRPSSECIGYATKDEQCCTIGESKHGKRPLKLFGLQVERITDGRQGYSVRAVEVSCEDCRAAERYNDESCSPFGPDGKYGELG